MALVLIAGVLSSCKKKDKGILLAKYDGGEMYSKDTDVQQWSDYLYGYYFDYLEDGSLSTARLGEIIVNTVLLHRLEDMDIVERKITISDEEIQEAYEFNKLNFDEYYDGGFEKFKEDSGLGDDFWMEFARYSIVENLIIDRLVYEEDFSKEELLNYFNANYSDYMISAGYEYSAVFVEVLDTSSEEEWATKKTAADGYLSRILSGEDFDEIKNEILDTYKIEDGYSNTHYASGKGSVSKSEFVDVTDLDAALAQAKEQFPDEKDFLKYLSVCMKYEQCYAMKNLADGEVYSKLIKTPVGWMLLKLEQYRENSYYPTYEDVKDKVIEDYVKKLYEDGSLLDNYRKKLMIKYNVVMEDVVLG